MSTTRGPMVRTAGRLPAEAYSDWVERSKGGEGSKGGVKVVFEESKVMKGSCRVEKSTGVRVAEESVVVVVAVVELEVPVVVEASRASKSRS
jgi:hypothetical protein